MMMQRQYFGLVLAEVNIGPRSGTHLLQTVRDDPNLYQLCFILMSAERRPDAIIEAHRLRVDAFLLKPFDFAYLRGKIVSLSKLNSSFRPHANQRLAALRQRLAGRSREIED